MNARAELGAKVIDGRAVARHMRLGLTERVKALAAEGLPPGLAVIVIGDDPASAVYVRNKANACRDLGMHSEVHRFPAGCAQGEVITRIQALNADDRIHGVIVQLPLPPRFDLRRVLESVALEKDVDGFHLYNVGGLVIGDTIFPPCTPYGGRLSGPVSP